MDTIFSLQFSFCCYILKRNLRILGAKSILFVYSQKKKYLSKYPNEIQFYLNQIFLTYLNTYFIFIIKSCTNVISDEYFFPYCISNRAYSLVGKALLFILEMSCLNKDSY